MKSATAVAFLSKITKAAASQRKGTDDKERESNFIEKKNLPCALLFIF